MNMFYGKAAPFPYRASVLAAAICVGASLSSGVNGAPASAAPSNSAGESAGGWLTKEEVAAVQGCAITGVQSKATGGAQMRVMQCYYAAAHPEKSVSLTVIQAGPEG